MLCNEAVQNKVNTTVYNLVEAAAEQFPERVALQMEEGGKLRVFNYREFSQTIKSVATLLKSQGVTLGMRATILSENRPEAIIAYFALLACDAVPVILDTNLEPDDYQLLLSDSESSLIIVSDALQKKLQFTHQYPVLALQNKFAPINDHPMVEHSKPVDHLATILYTSGTTGKYKGVMLSHDNICFAIESATKIVVPVSQEVVISLLPMFHVYGLICSSLALLAVGGKLVFVESMQGNIILQTMRHNQCTILVAVPRLLQLIAANIQKQVESANKIKKILFSTCYFTSRLLSRYVGTNAGKWIFRSIHKKFGGRLRTIISGGASLDLPTLNYLHVLGFNIREGYGLTETTSLTTVNPHNEMRPGTVGKAIGTVEIRLHNPDITGEGEIAIRSRSVMLGYYRNEADTAAVLRNGWFYTGDLGRFDRHGYLSISGRIKELIVKPNGEKAMPNDVEERYKNIPGVADLAIIGMPNAHSHGEEIHAAIVPTSDYESEASYKAIIQSIAERSQQVPSNLRIQQCHFVAELPKTSTLKIKRNVLVKKLLANRGEAGKQPLQLINMDEIDNRIYQIVADILSTTTKYSIENLHPETSLQFDLGLDSLHRLELIERIQTSFGVSFTEEQFTTFYTLNDVSRALQQGNKQKPVPAIKKYQKILSQGKASKFFQQSVFSGIQKALSFYVNLQCDGQENIPLNENVIFCANHTSHLDSFIIAATSGLPIHKLYFIAAKDYHFKNGIKNKITNKLFNLIPFDRNSELSGMFEGLQACREYVAKHKKLVCFPEGTRSLDGELQKFKSAIAMIAYELNLTIVPAYIHGAHTCMPKGKVFPKRGHVNITYGKPIRMTNYRMLQDSFSGYEIYKKILSDLRHAIEGLQ